MNLENLCRKVLKIGENITYLQIIDFIKEYGFRHEYLFLINFLSGTPKSLVSTKTLRLYRIDILAFVEKHGIYGKYRTIYCVDSNGNFSKYYANTKINQYLDCVSCKKTRNDIFIPKEKVMFFPEEILEYKKICYLKVFI